MSVHFQNQTNYINIDKWLINKRKWDLYRCVRVFNVNLLQDDLFPGLSR